MGIQVQDRLVLLVEAQSVFSVNIVLRLLMYLAATYKEYVAAQEISLYSTKAAAVPLAELHVVYNGSQWEMDKKEIDRDAKAELAALYSELQKRLNPLGRIDELLDAISDTNKLTSLAQEFGLKMQLCYSSETEKSA